MSLGKLKPFSLSSLLLMAFFATIPLYLTEAYRISLGGLTLPINILLLVSLFFYIIHRKEMLKINKNMFIIFFLLLLLFVMHLISFELNNASSKAFPYLIKFFFSILIYFMAYKIAQVFFTSEKIFVKYFTIAGIISSLFLGYLIYFYFFILHSEALGIMLNDMSNSHAGKNQLQIYLVLIVPFIIYQLSKKQSIILYITLFVHLGATMYVGSRGLWVSLFVGFILYIIPNMAYGTIKLKISKHFLKKMFFMIILLFLLLPLLVDFETEHILSKFSSLLNLFDSLFSNNIQLNRGMDERSLLLSWAYDLFTNNIIFGNGLGYFQTHNDYSKLTHNDYMFFLADMGIMTFFIFLLFEISLVRKIVKNGLPAYLILPFCIDLFFVNAYLFPLFWILSGFYSGIKFKNNRGISI